MPTLDLSLEQASALEVPFHLGALYSRRDDIHARWGGQTRGGISTPRDAPFVFIFTGEAGKAHGYADHWDDDGTLHYFGEGQRGDMKMSGGNKAINQHIVDGKRLLVFKSLGHGKPYRFDGEFVKLSAYVRADMPDTSGENRIAIVFQLRPLNPDGQRTRHSIVDPRDMELEVGSTVAMRLGEVRTKQHLFRRRLIEIEKQCRITGIMDLRFLRASHIKPWSGSNAAERTDGHNGLLLTPTADHLFDRGWISFEAGGRLLVAKDFPTDVVSRIGLKLRPGRSCGKFNEVQAGYLEFHRNKIFDLAFQSERSPVSALIDEFGA